MTQSGLLLAIECLERDVALQEKQADELLRAPADTPEERECNRRRAAACKAYAAELMSVVHEFRAYPHAGSVAASPSVPSAPSAVVPFSDPDPLEDP